MITFIEALNFRCLRYISQPLESFHILVGANATGKTTLLDVIGFLGKFVSEGLDAAINERTQNFEDLTWKRQTNGFELCIEAKIPEDRRILLSPKIYDVVRYEVSIEIDSISQEILVRSERVLLKEQKMKPLNTKEEIAQKSFFDLSKEVVPPSTLIATKNQNSKVVINKSGNDNFYSETGKGWKHAFKLGSRRSALGNLPEDESHFPASTWLRRLLTEGVQQFILNSLVIRKASPPGQPLHFKSDGSNLPWVIDHLKKTSPDRFKDWIAHLQTAIPDIEDIDTIQREDDKHRYLIINYTQGFKAPSWVLSDGTLRLLALTIPAYLTNFKGIYLIEEPENGIHPRAVETVYNSLYSVYDAQMLIATHSPVIISISDQNNILCFAKDENGATSIVSGKDHPKLQNWQGKTNLGVLFAAGVLG